MIVKESVEFLGAPEQFTSYSYVYEDRYDNILLENTVKGQRTHY